MDVPFLKCAGCNAEYSFGFCVPIHNCINYGEDDADHILEKHLPSDFRFKMSKVIAQKANEQNPYKLFKDFFYSYHQAEYLDIDFDAILNGIDRNLIAMGEPPFRFTPLVTVDRIEGIEGKTIIKNETCNVAGSHKARHMLGNILYIEALRQTGMLEENPRLATYSCGNAALAAAAIAKAANYTIDVFIPTNVNQHVLEKLQSYDANIIECPRIPGETGDPCYNKFHDAITSGAIPFSCSGPDNWSNIEGGQTLCLELMADLVKQNELLDSIVLQVGGGALASSAVKSIEELFYAGVLSKLPSIYTVQTEGGYPLLRAYLLLIKEIADNNNLHCTFDFQRNASYKDAENRKILDYHASHGDEIKEIVSFIKQHYSSEEVQAVLRKAVQENMSLYMWNWELEPHSIAHGILDDMTYDWFKIVQGMFRTGGMPITVSENELKDYNALARKVTDINVDHTGSSGFAGYMKLKKLGIIPPEATSAVFFTGIQR